MSRLFSVRSRRVKDLGDDSVSQNKKKWSSESDLHRLPPLSLPVPIVASPRLSRKDNHRLRATLSPRPPTPSPNRRGDNFILGKQRLAPLSPCNSTQKLSLNLDLNTLKEEVVAIEELRNKSSPDRAEKFLTLDNTRMSVRSLPSSPVMRRDIRQRSQFHKPLSNDSDFSSNLSKDDRIAEWVRDVQRYEDNVFAVTDDTVEFSSTSDSSEQELGSSPGLPAIQEIGTYHSSTS